MMGRGTGTIEAEAQTAVHRLRGHLRYLQYGQRQREERSADRWIFNATADQVRLKDALAALIGAAQPQVVCHTFVLAPEAGPVGEYRAWARRQMRTLAQQECRPLCWFGVLHQHPEGAHIHVVLAGAQDAAAHQRPAAPPSIPRPRGVLLRLPLRTKKESGV